MRGWHQTLKDSAAVGVASTLGEICKDLFLFCMGPGKKDEPSRKEKLLMQCPNWCKSDILKSTVFHVSVIWSSFLNKRERTNFDKFKDTDYYILSAGRSVWAGKKDRELIMSTHLSYAWVGALHIFGGQVQPASGVRVDGRAVVPQCTSSLSTAPSTLELPVCLQTHATAVPLGCTLVQEHCGAKEADWWTHSN